jgi:hypothetical protein
VPVKAEPMEVRPAAAPTAAAAAPAAADGPTPMDT